MENAPRPQAISMVVNNCCLAGGHMSPPAASLRQDPVAATQCTFQNYLSEILIFHPLSLDYNSRLFLKSIWGYVNIIVFLCKCWVKTVLKNMYILRSLSI